MASFPQKLAANLAAFLRSENKVLLFKELKSMTWWRRTLETTPSGTCQLMVKTEKWPRSFRKPVSSCWATTRRRRLSLAPNVKDFLSLTALTPEQVKVALDLVIEEKQVSQVWDDQPRANGQTQFQKPQSKQSQPWQRSKKRFSPCFKSTVHVSGESDSMPCCKNSYVVRLVFREMIVQSIWSFAVLFHKRLSHIRHRCCCCCQMP